VTVNLTTYVTRETYARIELLLEAHRSDMTVVRWLGLCARARKAESGDTPFGRELRHKVGMRLPYRDDTRTIVAAVPFGTLPPKKARGALTGAGWARCVIEWALSRELVPEDVNPGTRARREKRERRLNENRDAIKAALSAALSEVATSLFR
jgi:hypothetical protein